MSNEQQYIYQTVKTKNISCHESNKSTLFQSKLLLHPPKSSKYTVIGCVQNRKQKYTSQLFEYFTSIALRTPHFLQICSLEICKQTKTPVAISCYSSRAVGREQHTIEFRNLFRGAGGIFFLFKLCRLNRQLHIKPLSLEKNEKQFFE